LTAAVTYHFPVLALADFGDGALAGGTAVAGAIAGEHGVDAPASGVVTVAGADADDVLAVPIERQRARPRRFERLVVQYLLLDPFDAALRAWPDVVEDA
jgi:hypothetical protein